VDGGNAATPDIVISPVYTAYSDVHTLLSGWYFLLGVVTWDWQGKSADVISLSLATSGPLQHQVINNSNSGYSFTPGLWPVLPDGYHDVGEVIADKHTAIRVEVTPGS
jgi:hypothetical protein